MSDREKYRQKFASYPDLVNLIQFREMLGGIADSTARKLMRENRVKHYYIRTTYANGVSLKEIQEWLGHSDISTTSNIYTHLDFSSKVSSANAILPAFPKNVQHFAYGQ